MKSSDRLVMVTNGYLERGAAQVDMAAVLAAGADRHPRQVVQELAPSVLAATGGRVPDDATVLCVDFHGPAGHRNAAGGASLVSASSP